MIVDNILEEVDSLRYRRWCRGLPRSVVFLAFHHGWSGMTLPWNL